MQETNIRNFVHATEDDVHIYVKMEYLGIYRSLQVNTLRFEW
jgi:hypothetical protein